MNFLLFATAYLFMEFVAWSNHKYVMHGFLWRWHMDHHINDNKKYIPGIADRKALEKNDLFFLIYAIPAIVLMITGLFTQIVELVYLAAGITAYGFTYFTIHDIAIHQRVPLKFLINSKNRYLRAIIRAHTAHHRPKSKDDFDNYGLLIFPRRFFKA